ncbi:hypothetical protein OFN23_27730, partial [Escherichia coli]|nr:hypothetical protein [Escherichia coli]
MGDGDTGLKWQSDGKLQSWSNNIPVTELDKSEIKFNRNATFRFRSDNGEIDLMTPDGMSLVKIDTTKDGNNTGDSISYLGLVNSGKYNHYLRGTGRTYIDTHEGLGVAGPTSFYQTIFNN